MAELGNRKTRDDQRHAEKMLDKQIELCKLELCLEKERNRACSQVIYTDPLVISISSTSTPRATSQAGSPAVQGSTLPNAPTGIAVHDQFGGFGVKHKF